MTTLPQTTTVRVPRTTGPSTLMVPGMPMPGIQNPAMAGQMSGADVWRVIRANIILIITTVLLFAALGVGAFFLLAKWFPRYEAVGLVEVQPVVNVDPLLQAPNPDSKTIDVEQRTQAARMTHERLTSELLQRSQNIKATAWYRQFDNNVKDAKEDFLERLRVTPLVDTRLIRVSVTAADPADAATMVQELVDLHLLLQGERRRDEQLARSQTLTEMRNNNQLRLNELEEKLRQKGGNLAMDNLGVPGHLNNKDTEASQLMIRYVEQQSRLEATKTTLERFAARAQVGEESPEVEDMLARDPMLASSRQTLDMLDVEIAEMEKLGAGHPLIKQRKARREAMAKKFDDLRAEQTAKYRASYSERLKAAVAIEQLGVDRIRHELESVRADFKNLTADLNIYLSLLDEQKNIRENLKKIQKELEDIQSYRNRVDQAGVFWYSKPSVPDIRSFPRLPWTMAAAIMMGLALSIGLAFLREMLDTTVRSPRDIARIGQLNLLGMVPDEQDDPQLAGVRLPLAIFEAPHSIVAEQLRQIRTRLQHSVSLDTTRAILVTSAGPGDGKTVIAANIAAGLALNGRRILLVDANFRRPQLHTIFGMSNEKGFANALANPADFAQHVTPTPIHNLSVMACGPKPPNATELLESQLLIDFIDHALDDYDHVVFDSGPLLFVSESVALAPRVDGVVTIVRAQQNSRGALQRVRDTLRQIKAQQIGVVLNAVKAQGGGYYAQNIRTYYEYQGNLPVKM